MIDGPRVGLGFDVHPLDPSRPLWLGGLHFDDEPGLAGHSDGDAVCHALADAMLGAAALGDVGEHFPDTDPAFAGISGSDLLAKTMDVVLASGLVPTSCDLTVIAERPAVGPRRTAMRERLSALLHLPIDHVSVKATRPEGLGLAGDGIGCLAVVVLT